MKSLIIGYGTTGKSFEKFLATNSISFDIFDEDKTKLEKWKSGGINSAEIYLSQKFADSGMKYFSYDLKKFRTLPPLTIIYILIFPFKVLFSALLNMSQKVSIFKTVRKIFFRK